MKLPKQAKILRNMARCKKCGDVIESTHVHDLRWCKCHTVFVDGGRAYLRRGATDVEALEEISVTEEPSE